MPTVQLPADMPSRMKQLPRDEVGRPIPFFAAEVDGHHDFRVMEPESLFLAIRDQLCWVCGSRLGRVRNTSAPRGVFVAGPMCLINRTSAEPPSHADCAEWSAKACPFLAKPAKERRQGHMPETAEMPGIGIMRNPGVTALISSNQWSTWDPGEIAGQHGVLFSFSRIDSVHWMTEGHRASVSEVMDSIESGIPVLAEMAESEQGAMVHLARKTRDALRWVGTFDIAQYPNVAAVLRHLL